jgi:hypothetical protein
MTDSFKQCSKHVNEHDILQYDLNKLTLWSDRMQLNFNASKCKFLQYGRNNKQLQYTMNDRQNILDVQAEQQN